MLTKKNRLKVLCCQGSSKTKTSTAMTVGKDSLMK